MQISFCFCKTCICLKILENIQIPVNMIDIITDGFSVKCVFILNTFIFNDAALNISLRKFWKGNVLWLYLFGQGVPNETKGMINLNFFLAIQIGAALYIFIDKSRIYHKEHEIRYNVFFAKHVIIISK